MRRIASLGILLCLLLSACGAQGDGSAPAVSAGAEKVQVHSIAPEKAKERIDSGDPLTILDVRTPEEYEEAHIPGAVLLESDTLRENASAVLPVTDAEILVYCRTGRRSAEAAKELVSLGYTGIYDLGGITDWPYDTEQGPWESTKERTLASFRAVDLDGAPVDESLFVEHKLTMLNIWATFCSPCLGEMPELAELNRTYADRGVQVVGLVVDTTGDGGAIDMEQVKLARSLVGQTKADYRHLLPTADLAYAALQGVSVVPTTLFINEKGEQVGPSYEGARSGEKWAELIDSLLEKQGA